MAQLTERQKKDLHYFWVYKGDLERWSSFEELKPQIEIEFPKILRAWYKYKKSIKRLDKIFENFEYDESKC